MTASFVSRSAAETEGFAESFAVSLKDGDVVAFRGGLGAGKTAFTRGLARGLGLNPEDVVSPTFTIMNVYEPKDPKSGGLCLYHFDMYRTGGPDALYSAGFFDCANGIAAVEWSENVSGELPSNAIIVTITVVDENTREISISGC